MEGPGPPCCDIEGHIPLASPRYSPDFLTCCGVLECTPLVADIEYLSDKNE